MLSWSLWQRTYLSFLSRITRTCNRSYFTLFRCNQACIWIDVIKKLHNKQWIEMEVFESCLDYLVTILFGMIERVVPKWCLSHSGTCKIYLWVKKIPATELSLREGEIPATDFGSMLFLAGGIPTMELCCRGSCHGRTCYRLLTSLGSHQGEDPKYAEVRALLWASLHLSGDSPKGSRQGRTRYKLLTSSGSHQGKDPMSAEFRVVIGASLHLSGDSPRCNWSVTDVAYLSSHFHIYSIINTTF